MKVLVTGGRHYSNSKLVFAALDTIGADRITLLIHGDATGADTLADNWAKANGVFIAKFPIFPNTWKKEGKKAGYLRNKLMLDVCSPDLVVAFAGNNGTKNMIELALTADVNVIIVDDTEL